MTVPPPSLGIQRKIVTQKLQLCITSHDKFYGCFTPKIIFRKARRIMSFFPYKERLRSSLKSLGLKTFIRPGAGIVIMAILGKQYCRLHDSKTEHFKTMTSNTHSSAIADHMTQTGHRIKWDHFDI